MRPVAYVVALIEYQTGRTIEIENCELSIAEEVDATDEFFAGAWVSEESGFFAWVALRLASRPA